MSLDNSFGHCSLLFRQLNVRLSLFILYLLRKGVHFCSLACKLDYLLLFIWIYTLIIILLFFWRFLFSLSCLDYQYLFVLGVGARQVLILSNLQSDNSNKESERKDNNGLVYTKICTAKDKSKTSGWHVSLNVAQVSGHVGS